MLYFKEKENFGTIIEIEASQGQFDNAPLDQKFTCDLYSCYEGLSWQSTKEDILNQSSQIEKPE